MTDANLVLGYHDPAFFLGGRMALDLAAARLGVVVPLAEQVDSEAGKWAPLARPPIYAVTSPYAPTALADLARCGARGVLLDCVGFVERRRAAARAAGPPVIPSNGLVAKLVSEIV